MNIPTQADWDSEPLCRDGQWAYEHFFGLDELQATELFVENALAYNESLLFMPLGCFRYYIHSFMRYLLSPASERDSDGAHAFFGVVKLRCADLPAEDPVFQDKLRAVLQRLASGQEWFDADVGIYGSFAAKARQCCKLALPDPEAL